MREKQPRRKRVGKESQAAGQVRRVARSGEGRCCRGVLAEQCRAAQAGRTALCTLHRSGSSVRSIAAVEAIMAKRSNSLQPRLHPTLSSPLIRLHQSFPSLLRVGPLPSPRLRGSLASSRTASPYITAHRTRPQHPQAIHPAAAPAPSSSHTTSISSSPALHSSSLHRLSHTPQSRSLLPLHFPSYTPLPLHCSPLHSPPLHVPPLTLIPLHCVLHLFSEHGQHFACDDESACYVDGCGCDAQ